jgi:hypothetical protein
VRSRGPRLPEQLQRRVRRWPPLARAAVSRYLSPGRGRRSAERQDADPIWLLLPAWLAARAPRSPGGSFLSDVRWGQYCLFLFVRIHDDVFDGHHADPALIYVADLLLVESEEAFARHFSTGPFWPFYRRSLATTLAAILERDGFERRPRGLGADDRGVHARVSSLFKVGAAAVCFKTRRPGDLQSTARYLDHLAIAGQMLDDLRDLQADLDRGRVNSVAGALARGRRGLDDVVADMRRHLRSAIAAIAPLRMPAAERHAAQLLRGVEILGAGLHRIDVRRAFGVRGAAGRLL